MTPTTQQKIIRGLLWIALGIHWVFYGALWLVAAVSFLTLQSLEMLGDAIRAKLGLAERY